MHLDIARRRQNRGPGFSYFLYTGAMSWSRSDSGIPATRITSDRMACFGTRLSKSRQALLREHRLHLVRGAGQQQQRRAGFVRSTGRALSPRSLGRIIGPSTMNAWRLFTSDILRPIFRKRCSSWSAISGWKFSLRSSAWSTASRGDVVLGGAQAAGDDDVSARCGRHGGSSRRAGRGRRRQRTW